MLDTTFDDEETQRIKLERQIKSKNEQVPKLMMNGKLVNGVEMKHDSCFGINYSKIHNHLLNIGEGHVMFMVGTSLGLKDLNSKQTEFFHKEGKFQNVTCLAGGHEERTERIERDGETREVKKNSLILAIGESTPQGKETPAFITIIEYEKHGKQKWSTVNLNTEGYIQSMTLNLEKKYLAVLLLQSGSQYSYVKLWKYNPEKLLASQQIKSPVEKISMHPTKPKHILFMGPNYCRLWEVFFQEKMLKEVPQAILSQKIEKENKIIDHCWSKYNNQKYLLILLEKGRLIIVHNETPKRILPIDSTQLSYVDDIATDGSMLEQDDYFDMNIDDREKGGADSKHQRRAGDEEHKSYANGYDTQLSNIENGIDFTCITSSRKGFLLGGTRGFVGSYELEKNYSFTNSSNYRLKNAEDHKVVFLSINNGDSIATAVSSTLDGNYEHYHYHLVHMLQIDSGVSPTETFYPLGYHNTKVTCLTTSRTRAIFASCGLDNYVRIWNYSDMENDEKHGFIAHHFKEEPLGASLHPFGHFIAIAFGNCFRIYAILSDSLVHLTTTNLTVCRVIKYSNGGHLLVTNERYNLIVYDTVYYTPLLSFDEGHAAPIKDIVITEDDAGIISTDDNGAVYFWKVRDDKNERFNKIQEHRNNMYNKIQYDTKNDLFFGCTAEKNLCIYGKRCTQKICEFLAPDFDVRAGVISEKKGVLFLGTNKGTIRILLWPIRENTLELEPVKDEAFGTFRYKYPDFVEITTHLTAISAMELSPDHNYLFAASEDGTIMIFKIKEVNEDEEKTLNPEDLKKGIIVERADFGAFTNEVYLEKYSKLKAKSEKIKKLKFEVLKSQQTVKIEGKKLELTFKNRIQTIDEDHSKTLDVNSRKKDTFVTKSQADYDAADEKYQDERNNFNESREQTAQRHIEKEEFEMQRNKELEEQIQIIKEEHKQNLKNLIGKNREEILNLRRFYQEKCEKVQFKYNQLTENARQYGSLFLDRMEKQEADAEREIDDKVKEIKQDILKEEEILKGLNGRNRTLMDENEKLKKQDTTYQQNVNDLLAENNSVKELYLRINADIQKMEEQLIEREEVILSKEETCKSAKDEQLNLENFRYLLDQKIKMLSSDKHDTLQRIDRQERQLKETFQELIKESNKNDDKHEESKKKDNAIKVLQLELKKLDFEIFFTRNKINDLNSNISKLVADKDNKDKWPRTLKDILTRVSSVNNELNSKVQSKRELTDEEIFDILQQAGEKAFNVNDELLRQAKWITKKLYLINSTGKKLREVREENIQTVLSQNGKLIEECNLLRKENEKQNNKLRNLEKIVNEGLKKKRRQDVQRPIANINTKSLSSISKSGRLLDAKVMRSAELKHGSDSEEDYRKSILYKHGSSENVSTDVSLRKPSTQQPNFSARKSEASANSSIIGPKRGNVDPLNHPKIEEAPVELERAQSK